MASAGDSDVNCSVAVNNDTSGARSPDSNALNGRGCHLRTSLETSMPAGARSRVKCFPSPQVGRSGSNTKASDRQEMGLTLECAPRVILVPEIADVELLLC